MNRTIRDLLLLFPRGGIKWLLRDEFSDTRAVGAVNGTPATPGPGTRVVVDTDGDAVAVSGGAVTFANPNNNWTSHNVYYPAITRAAGIVLIMAHNGLPAAAANDMFMPGWGIDQVAIIADGGHGALFIISNLRAFEGNASGVQVVAAYSINTAYRLAFILRSTGCYFLIRGGAFTTWTLLWVSAQHANTPLYPALINYGCTCSIDYIRVPVETWLPTPLCADTYTRANGPIGASEVVGPDGQAVVSRAYTDQVGTWDISGNTAVATALGIVTLPALHADVVLRCTLTTPGAGVTPGGIVVRWLDANNYWYVRVTPGTAGNDVELVEVNAGVPTVRGAADKDPAAATAYTIAVITYGQTIDVFWNNVREIHYITAALNETQGIHGLRDEGNSNFVFDNLQVFPRGTGGEYAALNTWSS